MTNRECCTRQTAEDCNSGARGTADQIMEVPEVKREISSESKAMSDGRERSRDDLDASRQMTVIKQEGTSDAAIHCGSSLSAPFKQKGSTITMLNKSLWGHTLPDTRLDDSMHLPQPTDAALLPFRVKAEPVSDVEEEQKGRYDPLGIQMKQEDTAEHTDAAVLPFRVKAEPASDEEENWEQKGSHTGDDLLDIQIKQEITFEEHHLDSMEEEVSLKEETEEESRLEMDEFCDNSVVAKSENDVPDIDISEEDSMSDATEDMDKQQHCGGGDKKRHIFQKHIRKLCHASEAGHTCSVCGKVYLKSQTCLWHIRHEHTGDEPHACNLCGKAFKRVYNLDRHKAYHSNERPYSCDACGKTFKVKGDLNRHQAKHSNERSYSCDLCDKAFTRKRYLQQHKCVCHTDKRPFFCNECGKSFKRKTDVQQHKVKCHSDERPYACDLCEKAFKAKAHLQQHKQAFHFKKRPYLCDVCGKAYTRKSTMRQHKLVCHSDVRPYACDLCEKAFTMEVHLQEHKLHHSNQRPYSSDVCGRGFTQHADVKQHGAKHDAASQSNEQTGFCEEGNENAVLS